LEVSRSGFYAWLKREESARSREDRRLLSEIKEIHKGSRGTYGVPRVHEELRTRGKRCGKNRVARLMRGAGLQSKVRRRFRKTTDSSHSRPVAPNLLEGKPVPERPNEVWVADITYIPTAEGWLYLASIMDLCSRLIVGWSMDATLKTSLVLGALRMALGRRSPGRGLIHHSDRGSQYASEAYQEVLREHGIACSMSRKGNCYDNAFKESFYHTLKTELVCHERYPSRTAARASVFDYIEVFYNRERRHSSIGYHTPSEFEMLLATDYAA
jgi:transposase InsO family protein